MRYLFILLFSLLNISQAYAQFALPPISLGGQLTYSILDSKRDRETAADENHKTQHTFLRLNAGTYIYQPWFALLNGSLFVSDQNTHRTFDNLVEISDQPEQDDVANVVSGDLNLKLFPRSHFPLELYYQRSDSTTESLFGNNNGDVGNTQDFFSNQLTTRYGLSQSYDAKRWDGRYSLRAEKISVTDSDQLNDEGQYVNFSAGHNLGDHDLNLDLSHSSTEIRQLNEEISENFRSELEHRYRPREIDISARSRFTYDQEDLTFADVREVDRKSTQLYHFTSWTPAKYDSFRFTLNAQTRENESDSSSAAGVQQSEQSNTSVNLGASYQINRAWQVSGSIGAHMTDSSFDDSEQTGTNEVVRVRYRPDSIELGPVLYSWSVSASAKHDQNDGEESESFNLGLGHRLSRHIELEDSAGLSLGFNQFVNGTQVQSSRQEHDQSGSLNQQASVRYSKNAGPANFFSSFTLSDTRSVDEQDSSTQSAAAQISGMLRLNNYSHISGNLSVKKALNETTRDDDIDESVTSKDDTTLSANLEYRHNRAFGVKNLNFRSGLLLTDRQTDNEDSNLDRLLNTQRDAQRTWENQLTYRIGLIDLRLTAALSKNDESTDNVLLFQISRAFYGGF